MTGKIRLLGRTVLWIACAAIAVGYPGYRFARGYIAGTLNEQLRSETASIRQALETAVLQKSVLLKKFALEAGGYCRSGDRAACMSLPERYVAAYAPARGLGLHFQEGTFKDGSGLAVYSFRDEGQPSTIEGPSGDMKTFSQKKEADQVAWLPFRLHPLTGTPTMTAVYPVLTADGRWRGTATCDMEIFELQKLLTARGLPESLTVDLLDEKGIVLASTRPAALMRPVGQNASQNFARTVTTVLSEPAGALSYAEGTVTMRLFFESLPGTGWRILIRTPATEDLRNVKWFWKNDVRIYSCCGFHTVRRTEASRGSEEAVPPDAPRPPRFGVPLKGRRFGPSAPDR